MFDWDPAKARANWTKHGVSFEEAATAFDDPQGLDGKDIAHSTHEPRRLRLARSFSGATLIIAYTMRRRGHEEEVTRIISARRASRKERTHYQASKD